MILIVSDNRDINEAVQKVITYDILWESIKKKGLKKQDLVEKYEFSKGLMDNLKHNRSITMTTLNDICNKLDLQPDQVFQYTKDK